MVKFRDAEHLADYLKTLDLDEDYASYAHNLWEGLIRSKEKLSRATPEILAATLARPNQPDMKHVNDAADMIRLSRDAKPSDADMSVDVRPGDPAKAVHEVQRQSEVDGPDKDAPPLENSQTSKRRRMQPTDPPQPSASTICADESLARQKPLVFLSHEGGGSDKTTKRNEVSLLHSWLKIKGIPAFLDEHSLRLGDRNAQVMEAAVKEAPVCES
jgi:hypothetical protein